MLRGAVVGLETVEPQPVGGHDLGGQRHGLRARPHAAAVLADVDLDEHPEGDAAALRGLGGQRDPLARVDAQADLRALGQRSEPRRLAVVDDLVGQQHVIDPGGDERFGLGHRLAAHADRAGLDLTMGDRRALVRLAVRAQRDADGAARQCHGVHVVVERVEVDDQRRRLDRGDAVSCSLGDMLRT